MKAVIELASFSEFNETHQSFLDQLMAPPLAETMEIVSDGVQAFNFEDMLLPNNIALRGLDDTSGSSSLSSRASADCC